MAENKMVEKDFRSVVQKTGDAYIPLVEKALSGDGIPTDSYQHQCMANALIAMNDAAQAAGKESLAAFDKTEVMAALQQVAALRDGNWDAAAGLMPEISQAYETIVLAIQRSA